MAHHNEAAENVMQAVVEIFAEQEDEEVDVLMLTAQEYFHQDEDARLHTAQNRPVSS